MKLRTLLEMNSTTKIGNQPFDGENLLGIPVNYQDQKSIAWPKGKPKVGQKINVRLDNGQSKSCKIESYSNLLGTFDDGEVERGFKIKIYRDTNPEKYIIRVYAEENSNEVEY
jgi:hypothetical protein